MPYFSNTWIIVFIAVCAFLIIAKLLKVEKIATVLGLGVVVLWLVLHFTGYDKTLYHIIFEAPPVEPGNPENLKYR
jgi:amino acid permease